MAKYSIREETEKEEGRQVLTIWSGGFASQYEGYAVELPDKSGYMVSLEYKEPIDVLCPAPREDFNWMAVDDALNKALADV